MAGTIAKRRRESKDFPGAISPSCDQLAHGPTRLRVGIRPDGRAPARSDTVIAALDGTEAGTVTSGGFGPTARAAPSPWAMSARTSPPRAQSELNLLVRGKQLPARVTALPFVPHRYAR